MVVPLYRPLTPVPALIAPLLPSIAPSGIAVPGWHAAVPVTLVLLPVERGFVACVVVQSIHVPVLPIVVVVFQAVVDGCVVVC